MADSLPPPPTGADPGSFIWTSWYNSLYSLLTTAGTLAWSQVDKTGSNLSDLANRPHSALTSFQGGTPGEYYHLTAAQWASLGVGNHNDLLSKQGGAVNEFYHLNVNDYNKLINFASAPVTKTVSFTVAATECWLICNGAASITVTLPTASTNAGRQINLKTIAAFTVVSASSNVVPLAGGAAGTAILAATAGRYAKLISDGTNWIIMEAN
jgi:hypothetical protein